MECGGRDLTLRFRDISYSSYDDLRKVYRPGEHYDCILKEYDRASGRMRVSIKEGLALPPPQERIKRAQKARLVDIAQEWGHGQGEELGGFGD